MKQSGKCLCGKVTFEAEFSETGIHACHCTSCRSWSSSPLFAIGVDSVKFEGQENITVFNSSEWAERGFCNSCGSSLYYRLKEADHFIVCTGLFEDQSVFTLTGEIYIDESPGGYAFAGDHPRMTGDEFMASMQQPDG